MKPLSIREYMQGEPLPRETVEEAARNAFRAQALLDNEHFQWWRARVEAYVKDQYRQLAHGDATSLTLRQRRGIIQGVEKVLVELDTLASQLPRLQERLREYDGNK